MKTIRIHRFGGPEVMQLDQLPLPEPTEGELLVRVHAASVNPVDAKIREGKFPVVTPQMLPYALGRDVAGTVEKVGPGVAGFEAGEAVFALLGISHGAYATHAITTPAEAAPKPRSLSEVEAAAVPLAALTAWQGLFDHGGLREGQRVLIHGGTGGVGHFAVQFAKVKGAWVATTVAHRDRAFARNLGADQVIDFQEEKFEEEVRDLDLVFDLIGGETQDRSWKVLKRGGVLVSTVRAPPEEQALAHGVRGLRYTAQPNASQLAEIAHLIDGNQLKVMVARTFPLSEARDAQEYLGREHPRGKVVLTVP